MTHAEIDLLVHAYVMGHMNTRFELSAFGYDEEGWFLAGDNYFTDITRSLRYHEALYLLWDEENLRVPSYSTNGHAAIALAKWWSKDQNEIFYLTYFPRCDGWRVGFGAFDTYEIEANSASLAICLAALHAVGIDIEPEEVVE